MFNVLVEVIQWYQCEKYKIPAREFLYSIAYKYVAAKFYKYFNFFTSSVQHNYYFGKIEFFDFIIIGAHIVLQYMTWGNQYSENFYILLVGKSLFFYFLITIIKFNNLIPNNYKTMCWK